MATVTDLVGAGLSPLLARHLGDTILDAQTATGSTVADAFTVGQRTVVHFTTVGSGTGAILPLASTSEKGIVTLRNSGSNALTVYPGSGDSINALAADATFSVASGKSGIFTRVANKKWIGNLSG